MYRSLQASRAIAAAVVVLFHLGGMYGQDRYFGIDVTHRAFAWGDAGVDFFFVLSGFIITTAHRLDFDRPGKLGGYVFKRLLRIYPTYWIIAGAVCLAAVVVPALRYALPNDPADYVQAFLLLPQNKDVVGGTGSPILFVAWSLQYEMLFYAVIACFIVGRWAGLAVAAALALNWVACHLGASCAFPQSFLASNFLFLFLMGMGCAYLTKGPLQLPRPLACALAGFALFIAFGLFESSQASPVGYKMWVYGALSSLVILGLTQAETRGHLVLPQRWIALLGDASYSLYLLHVPVLSVLCKVFARLPIHDNVPAIMSTFALAFLATIACSIAFYQWIERPILAAGRSFVEKRRARGLAVAST